MGAPLLCASLTLHACRHIFDPSTAAYAQFRAKVDLYRQAMPSQAVPAATRRRRFDQPAAADAAVHSPVSHPVPQSSPAPDQSTPRPLYTQTPLASTPASTVLPATTTSSTNPALAAALAAAKAKAALLAKQVASTPQTPASVSLLVRTDVALMLRNTDHDGCGLTVTGARRVPSYADKSRPRRTDALHDPFWRGRSGPLPFRATSLMLLNPPFARVAGRH
jgi:hypothetical protein